MDTKVHLEDAPQYNFDVLIATPGTNFDYRHIRALFATMEALRDLGITYTWLSGHSSLVNVAREITLAGDTDFNFTERGPLRDTVDYKKIFMIDSDIVWTPDDFLKLYNSDKQVVSGLYVIGRDDKFESNLFDSKLKAIVPKDDEIIEVDSVGLGFVAVAKGVLESIPRPWFTYTTINMTDPYGNTIETSIGEDISWCWKLKEQNIKIYAEPSVRVGHIKPVVLAS